LPETLPEYDELAASGEGVNILICGKHGSNVDTIIFANVNPENKKVTLISLPRDLYYQERKINSVYYYYGMDEFIREVEDITGQQIDKYMLIDMYVFADIIDAMGGIDITLTEDLIDPSYTTYDNGIWSTLYYPAGDYHLNGTQTLRVARSRHYSSDYDRAERQQMILESIKDKGLSMGLSDTTALFEIVELVMYNTETDIGINEALMYYVQYKDYDISRGNVLSTGNILENQHVYVDYDTSAEEEVCDEVSGECEVQNFVYTLIPAGGNWDYIKWYFTQLLR